MAAVLSQQTPEFVHQSPSQPPDFSNYYLPCLQPDLVMGIAHHKDGGVATFLLLGEVVGLEVIKDERWVPHGSWSAIYVLQLMIHRAVANPIARFVIDHFVVIDTAVFETAVTLCIDLKPPGIEICEIWRLREDGVYERSPSSETACCENWSSNSVWEVWHTNLKPVLILDTRCLFSIQAVTVDQTQLFFR